jgi:hypothetical protein
VKPPRQGGLFDDDEPPPPPPRPPSRATAIAMRNEGMARTLAATERDSPMWSTYAARALGLYAWRFGVVDFLVEEAIPWMRSAGLADPKSARSWGPAITKAQRKHWIEATGKTRASRSSNMSQRQTWKRGARRPPGGEQL